MLEFSEMMGLTISQVNIAKGVFFTICTSLLLYFLIKRQQEVLITSEKQYRSLFYSNPNPQWIYDEETFCFLRVNEAAIKTYGYSAEEFKQMTIFDIRKKEFHGALSESLKRQRAGADPSGKWEHLKKNGETLIALISSHKTFFNKKRAVLIMAQDITLQLAQEEKLQMLYHTEKELKEELERNIELIEQSLSEKQRFIEVVDRVQNMVIITDGCGVITWVNQAFTVTTGYSIEEAVGKTASLLHGPDTDPTVQAEIMTTVQQKPFSVFEILNYNKSGQSYWVEINVSPIFDENNNIIRYISVENVITDRRLRDDQILKQNELLKKLAWTNSHAIRKPVASIMGLVELSKDITDLEDMQQLHYLIGVCINELDEITRQIAKVTEESDPSQIMSK